MSPQTVNANNPLTAAPYKDYGEMFDHIMAGVKTDKVMLDTNTAPAYKEEMYSAMYNGDVNSVIKQTRALIDGTLVRDIIVSYFERLNKEKGHPVSLAFSITHSKVFFWAQINDDDEASENALLIAEAYANAKFYDIGLNISTTIIEDSDNLPVPAHYIPVPLNEIVS